MTIDDVRHIASQFPGATEGTGEQFSFGVMVKGKHRGFCWSWMERVDPKKARVINRSVLAVSVPNLTIRDLLIASNPEVYFTEPHYNGYPAVLVRLEAIGLEELADLLEQAWRSRELRP